MASSLEQADGVPYFEDLLALEEREFAVLASEIEDDYHLSQVCAEIEEENTLFGGV